MSAVATTPSLAEQVEAVTEAILVVVREDPQGTWTPRELMDGVEGEYGMTVRSMAFWALVKAGKLVVDDSFTVRRGA